MSMSTPISVKQQNQAGAGEKPWVQLNQYSRPDFTANIIITGTASVDIEATLANPNRDEITPDDVFTLQGFQGITTTTAMSLANQPLAAIRVNQSSGAGSVVFHVNQNGG